MTEEISGKSSRLSTKELRRLLTDKKLKLTPEQKLVKSVLKEVNLSRNISAEDFKNAQEMYDFRRSYKNYLRIKRFIPLSLVAPFTGSELSKMAYAAVLGSKSISLTFPGLIGYFLTRVLFLSYVGILRARQV
jgi:hypothetical protein